MSDKILDEFKSPALKEAVRLALAGDPDQLNTAKVLIAAVTCQNQKRKVDQELNSSADDTDSELVDVIRNG